MKCLSQTSEPPLCCVSLAVSALSTTITMLLGEAGIAICTTGRGQLAGSCGWQHLGSLPWLKLVYSSVVKHDHKHSGFIEFFDLVSFGG